MGLHSIGGTPTLSQKASSILRQVDCNKVRQSHTVDPTHVSTAVSTILWIKLRNWNASSFGAVLQLLIAGVLKCQTCQCKGQWEKKQPAGESGTSVSSQRETFDLM